MFIQATDRLFYKNPVVVGRDWRCAFPNYEVESGECSNMELLVIKDDANIQDKMKKIVGRWGKIGDKLRISREIFPRMGFRECFQTDMTITGMIPARRIVHCEAILPIVPEGLWFELEIKHGNIPKIIDMDSALLEKLMDHLKVDSYIVKKGDNILKIKDNVLAYERGRRRKTYRF